MTNSQIATLRNVNERPGIKVGVIGFDCADALQAGGYITVRQGKCYPTTLATPYQGRSAAELRAADVDARAALIGRWAATTRA